MSGSPLDRSLPVLVLGFVLGGAAVLGIGQHRPQGPAAQAAAPRISNPLASLQAEKSQVQEPSRPEQTPRKQTMLAEAGDLAKRLGDPNVRVLDSRSGDEYAKSHVPGAVRVDVRDWQNLGRSEGGFHNTKAWAEKVGRLGIGNDSHVVVYGSRLSDTARVWWLLKYVGLKNVTLLNGGWDAWVKEGRPRETETPEIAAAPFRPNFQAGRLAEIDSLKESISNRDVRVVDTRSSDEFTGKQVRGKRGGHIPGATHLEWKELLGPDGRFKTTEQLRELFGQRGILPTHTAVCY